jgi:hypothetical protein
MPARPSASEELASALTCSLSSASSLGAGPGVFSTTTTDTTVALELLHDLAAHAPHMRRRSRDR